MCNILTFVDWWVKWKIGSWSLEIWLKNTLDRDLPMMKLLLLFNEFFLHLNAFHRNLNFLEQTCTFLHLLKQLSSLSYVCFIRHGIFILLQHFFSPWLFYFAVAFFVLPWIFCFATACFFHRGFFCFAVAFLFCHTIFFSLWLFLFCRSFFVLQSLL